MRLLPPKQATVSTSLMPMLMTAMSAYCCSARSLQARRSSCRQMKVDLAPKFAERRRFVCSEFSAFDTLGDRPAGLQLSGYDVEGCESAILIRHENFFCSASVGHHHEHVIWNESVSVSDRARHAQANRVGADSVCGWTQMCWRHASLGGYMP